MQALSTNRIRAAATTSTRQVQTRAAPRPVNGASKTIEQAATGLLAAGVALSLSCGFAPPALARTTVTFDQKRQEREAAMQAQLSKLEYAFEQQQTAARAEIVGKRQQLENTAQQVDTAIQRKLIEEAANEQAAAKKGEEQRALRIEAEAQKIKQQEAQIQVAVARAEAELDREGMVEKAREVEQKQKQESKAGGSMMDLLGLKSSDLGL